MKALWMHPEWQPGFVAVLALVGVALAAARIATGRRARRLLGRRGAGLGGLRAADLTLLVAVAVVGVALLGPRLGDRTVVSNASGVDLVVLLDVSPSMLAPDVPPSRLARAHETARRMLLALAPGDRVALAAFSGRGVLLTPLTPDMGALGRMLPALGPDLMQDRGSAIGAGVRAALAAFDSDGARPRVLLVLSDGEDPAGGDVAIGETVRAGARVVAALFGSEAGSTLPLQGGLLQDAGGRNVVSRREREPLAALTSASGGRLLLADRWGELDPDALLGAVGRDRGSVPGEPVVRRVPAARVAPLAVAAFALLVLELALGGRAQRRRRALALALASTLVAGGLGAGELRELEARVRASPGDPRALLALGLARADAGDPEEASRAFFAAAASARDPALAALAYYDLGVAELSAGRLEAAADAFYDALALRPEDLEAKFNLEWALRALRDEASAQPRKSDPVQQNPPEPGAEEPEREPEDDRREPGAAERPPVEAAPDLDEASVERWLAQVPDEPARALRDAARSGRRPARRAPGW